MDYVLYLLLPVVAIGAFLVVRRSSPPADTTQPAAAAPPTTNKKYHGVKIHAGPGACRAVIALNHRRFLSHEAKPLPLPDCDVVSCKCTYVHFDDRRSGDDRRYPKVEMDGVEASKEHRHIADRRTHS